MRRLYIENFGPVSKAELELKDVNMLIGEQSVGKSTIAKVVTIMTDYYSLMMLVHFGKDGWKRHLKTYNLTPYAKDNYLIKYYFEEKKVQFNFEITPQAVNYFCVDSNGNKNTESDYVQQQLLNLKPIFHSNIFSEQVNDLLTNKNNQEDTDTFIDSFSELMYNSLYIPAERIVYSLFSKLQPALNLMKESIPNNLLRFMIELTNAKSKYPQYEASLLRVKYVKEKSEDYIVDSKSKKKIHLSNASSGIQSTLPLLQVLDYAINHKEYSSFVIEEPESNLFPEKQVELLRYILEKVKGNKRIITITTHSPYLLSSLNNSLYLGYLTKRYGKKVDSVTPNIPRVTPGECSVYSLGASVNGDDIYCKSILDEKNNLINSNSLDGISFKMSDEFEEIEDAFIELRKR